MANRKKPLVVVTRKLPDSIETRMRGDDAGRRDRGKGRDA